MTEALSLAYHQALASTSLADRVEAECLLEPQVDCPLVHHFGPGIYVREVFMPAGTLVVGHCHKLAHLNVFLSGSLALLDDAGGFKVLHAPFLFVSPPGRKMAWTITDCTWQNIVATEETDIDALELLMFDKSAVFTLSEQQAKAAKAASQSDANAVQSPHSDEVSP
jgi:hypothetical protein